MSRVSDGVDRVPLLVDDAANEQFRREGFAITPLVEPERIAALRERMLPLIPDDSGPFFSLYRNDSPEIRKELNVAVREELQPAADRIMEGHRFFLGSLLVKFPGDDSYLEPHQDWSFVDEEQHVSGIVWFPLQATDESNGGLFVVPGSHRYDLPHRGAPLDYPIEGYLDGIFQCATSPGEAVVCHNALIHGSGENRSDQLRIVMVLGFASAEAHLLHYFTDDDGQKWRYKVSDEFFFDHEPPGQPVGAGVLGVEPWETADFETAARTEIRVSETGHSGLGA